MAHFYTLRSLLLTAFFICIANILAAQQTKIQDYVIFGGNISCAASGQTDPDDGLCSVQIGYGSKINSGDIGSFGLIKTGAIVKIGGNLYSAGKIELSGYNSVSGRIAAANTSSQTCTILQSGFSTSVGGNIDVNGNIVIASGKINGSVTHPKGTSYFGPLPVGGNKIGNPSLPGMPQMPSITNFPAAGNVSITSSQTIKAGAYDNILLGGNKTLTFSGTGIYIFNTIKNYGATNTYIFDFKNNPTGVFKLYIYGDVDLNKVNVKFLNGGDASRIYAEVHGIGKTCWDRKSSWSMSNGSGYSNSQISSWSGTVWAPYGAINIGSWSGASTVTGALLSGTQVNIGSGVTVNFVPFVSCTQPDVNAGPDKELNLLTTTELKGSSTTPGVQFSWQAINGGKIVSGANTSTAIVSVSGTYILTATSGAGCFATDTALVIGKTSDCIGPELKSLFASRDTTSALSKSIYLISNDSVYIDAVAIEGQYNTALALLQSPAYGMTDIIPNGKSKLIITGKFPIKNLLKLDTLPDLLNFCRPLYPPLTNSGVAQTQGDSAMRTNYVRSGFNVDGNNIRVGVISDSYNTLPGNPAFNDVVNGDLPGLGNAQNQFPVNVIRDYPFGRSTDEGRAMLQIVHDIAPKAKLSFRTGFISPGDFALGIRELAADTCNVIVDDITFITEPFFKKGVVDSAISDVTAQGISYITAAGNFGKKSYENVFQPIPAPGGLTGKAHDFGGGNFLQSDSLYGTPANPGIYTLVLQWVDDIYSISGSGTVNDLDIYLADDKGNPIIGYNRDNTGGDPIEVLPFAVTSNTTANIMIINNSLNPSPNLRFKYVVFRGDIKINGFAGASTIVGHGNAPEAITVGAARYTKTPAYGVKPPVLESYSSTGGGILADNNVSQKPDIVAPDGVNTTVNFGSVDLESDGLPNFFGTSAAAPHVAGAVALMLQARKKYYNESMSPAAVKNALIQNAVSMDPSGFNFSSGHGFIQADSALRSFANPTPQVIKLQLTDSSIKPGTKPTQVIIHGNFISPDTKILFGHDTLVTTINSSTQATITLPVFYSSQLIRAYTPSITPSGLDGGISNSITINGIPKKNIQIIANNKTRKYATIMPEFTSTILVDGDSLQNTTLSLLDLGLANIEYKTPASDTSSVGIYFIRPLRTFDSTNVTDSSFLVKYNYAFTNGALTITKLPVKISPRDTTLVYGQKAGNFAFNYQFDSTAVLANPSSLEGKVESDHESQLAGDVIGLVNGQAVTIVNGQAVPIVNGQAVTIVNGQAVTIVNGQAVTIVNGQAITIVNGQAVTIVNNLTQSQINNMSFLATTASLQNARQLQSSALENGNIIPQTTNVVDITQESILNFLTNSSQTSMLNSVSNVDAKGLVDPTSLSNGQAVTIVNGQAVTIVNGQAVTIVNGQAVTIVNGQAVPIVNGQDRTAVIVDSNEIGKGASQLKSLNMVTGLDAGSQYIIPAAFSNNNFEVSYGLGNLTILPAPITITALDTNKVFGDELVLDQKSYAITSGVLMYSDSIKSVTLTSAGTNAGASPGTYAIVPSAAFGSANTLVSNYNITYVNGKLNVGKISLIVTANDEVKVYGDNNPSFTATYSGFVNGQTFENSGITGMPAFGTTASVYSGVGSYSIVPSQGTLSSADYNFTFVNGTLRITPAPLIVKADDKVIYQYDRLPNFTAKITGLKAADNPTVSFTLNPSCAGAPGVYAIVPSLRGFPNASNYTISYQNGNLYINPKCGRAEDLKVRLTCVEMVSPGNYIAHFYCVNENATTLYIPVGSGNYLTSMGTFDASQQPVIFAPGVTKFDVPFDGSMLKWIIGSYDNCWYKINYVFASNWSPKCGNNLITDNSKAANGEVSSLNKVVTTSDATDNSNASLKKIIDAKSAIQGQLSVYPNPAQNTVIISYSNEEINEQGASLTDVNGKIHPVKLISRISPHSFEIDTSDLIRGFYFLRVKTSKGYQSIMIIKG